MFKNNTTCMYACSTIISILYFSQIILCTILNKKQNVTKLYKILDLYLYYYLLVESKKQNVIKWFICILSSPCRIMCMIILYPECLLVLYINVYMVTILIKEKW